MAAASKARQFHTQQTHFLRTLFNYSDADVSSGRKIGTIPAGSSILRINTCISTAFNSGTNHTVNVGTTATGTDLVSAGAAGSATANVVTQAPSGKSYFAADQDIYAWMDLTGTPATTGVSQVTVEYIPPL